MINAEKAKVCFLVCVYKNDTLENFEKCVNSMLNQTHSSCDIYIYVDGPIDQTLIDYMADLELKDKVVIFYDGDDVARGLAYGLNFLIEKALASSCSYDFLARMDADDISKENRIEVQLSHMEKSGADVTGSGSVEIDSEDVPISRREVLLTHDDLVSNIVKRCPFIHPSVVFRRRVFESGNRYDPELRNTQDYFLWVDLAKSGYKFSNVADRLLLFRRDSAFFKRRGVGKAFNEFKGRFYAMKVLGLYSFSNILFTVLLFFIRLSPSFISKIAYKYR